MKILIILSTLAVLGNAQRPFYASSGPIGRPGLASRFKEDNASSSTNVPVQNRVGEDGSTPKIPVDARGDLDLVNTLNTWDREHQPFWLLNADHIEKARNTTRGTQPVTQRTSGVQSSLSNRSGASDLIPSSGNGRNPPANNRVWPLGRPSQADIRPVHEYPEGSLSNQGIIRGQEQTGGSQRRLKFHYERNNFH